MSQQYDNYLFDHRHNLQLAFKWLQDNMPELFINLSEDVDIEHQIIMAHDRSKHWPEEYDAYDRYWYGGNKSFRIVHDYDIAWLHHIHNNPHHWQHWVFFKHDDPLETITIFEMPLNYIIEMICDWWSFGWESGDLTEILTWYDERRTYIKLDPATRMVVENILDTIKEKLKGLEEPV